MYYGVFFLCRLTISKIAQDTSSIHCIFVYTVVACAIIQIYFRKSYSKEDLGFYENIYDNVEIGFVSYVMFHWSCDVILFL